MHPKYISISEYNYELPDEKIAKYPLEKRDESKLLFWNETQPIIDQYKNINAYLPSNSMLIFNETKVVNARMIFQKSTGGKIEIFCLEPYASFVDITNAMLSKGEVYWKCLVGGISKWKNNDPIFAYINTGHQVITIQATIHEKLIDGYAIHLFWDSDITFAEILQYAGNIPIPPYLNRESDEKDLHTYQTVYAHHEGSVAAPTAGLHFTKELLHQLQQNQHKLSFLTLHVGAGTFKPVKSETMNEHEMHAEYLDVSLQFIEDILFQIKNKQPIVAVGTTSVRTLESLYWIGLKLEKDIKLSEAELMVDQWMPYEDDIEMISVEQSIDNIKNYLIFNKKQRLITKTQIIIAPGYNFKIVNGIVTNFHQPQSTLLLLVSAFIGKSWKQMYQYALENNFRFLSYGDGCLLLQ
jgi:S-adenosylmethionine:tRNA ribosyltransferase-isomerase